MIGCFSDFTGACRRVEVIAETTDGRYVVKGASLGLMLVPKKDIVLAASVDAQRDKEIEGADPSALDALADRQEE